MIRLRYLTGLFSIFMLFCLLPLSPDRSTVFAEEHKPTAFTSDKYQVQVHPLKSKKKSAKKKKEKKTLSTREFIASDGAKHFQEGRYEEAIIEFQKLSKEYPHDIFIQRYLGIAYYQVKKFAQSISTLQTALLLSPDNIATHYYLAEAFAHQARFENALTHYEFVQKNDVLGRYRDAASMRIEQLRAPVPEIIPFEAAPAKPWRFETAVGYEYDMNATFNPSDATLRSTADQNAGRFNLELNGSYRFFENGVWSAEADYIYSQTLYDDGLDFLNTYVNSAGLSASRSFDLWSRPLILRVRDSVTHILLDQKFFVFMNSLATTAFYSPHERFQMTGVYIFTYSEFENNTDRGDIFARDGYSHNFIWLNTIPFNEEQTFRFTFGYDYQHDITRGRNFIKNVHGVRAILHFPIPYLEKTEADIDIHYRHDERPSYLAETEDLSRLDDIWEMTFSVERKLWERATWKGFFSYNRTYSRNNAFEFTRPYFGTSLTLEY